jgi:hypothetical protein
LKSFSSFAATGAFSSDGIFLMSAARRPGFDIATGANAFSMKKRLIV